MNNLKLYALVTAEPIDISNNTAPEQYYKSIGTVKNIDSGDTVLFANSTCRTILKIILITSIKLELMKKII